jgi:predicted ATP-dependent endonuclease of OLD family
MKLVWFEVEKFRRFAKQNRVSLDGKVVAFVGSNEAGKTSLLRAIWHLSSDKPFTLEGPQQEITRGEAIDDEDVVAEWTFAIDASSDIAPFLGGHGAKWYSIKKRANGKFVHELSPRLKRDISGRRQLLELITNSNAVNRIQDNESIQMITDAKAILADEAQTISSTELKTLRSLSSVIEKFDEVQERDSLLLRLTELLEREEAKHPNEEALANLWKSKPSVLMFSQKHRNLESEYDLHSFFRDNNPQAGITQAPIPAALENIAAAANLDLEELYTAQKNKDRGRVKSLLEHANELLSSKVKKAWTQSELTVGLDLDQWKLTVLIRSKEGEYVQIAERSDGLRIFIALLMFLLRSPTEKTKPIVLIDEAETHLHYDAQADLVQMFARQELASKIIYTTHSVGCLPEDLGAGVRMVDAGDPHSTIQNWFWESNRPGFSPLLFAMGANTLAFVPIRYAVIGEGAADMILIPAILKEVLEIETLGFQVAPGLSSGTADQLAIVDRESPRTAFLVDGDTAGRRMHSKIREAGILSSRIIELPYINDSPETVVEDYLDIRSYLNAVNTELRRSRGNGVVLTEADLNGANRPQALAAWCRQRGVSVPSKRAVAYQIVEQRHQYPIVSECARAAAHELSDRINRALGL